jgi:phosphate transport system protein
MREHFLQQLRSLQEDVLRLGSQVELALKNATQALREWDTSLAQQVVSGDRDIDGATLALEEKALRLLATQQPVLATDLRAVSALNSITAELERMGDYAKGIAKRVQRCVSAPQLLEVPPSLFQMAERAQVMLHTCLDAYMRQDVDLAHSLAVEDEQVDELEDQVKAQLLTAVRADIAVLETAIELMGITHNIERLADRTTNIGERIIFVATSHMEELNP